MRSLKEIIKDITDNLNNIKYLIIEVIFFFAFLIECWKFVKTITI